MPQLVKKRRSGWAVLAAGALVASIFAVVGASPAAAAPREADGVAKWRACLGPAAESNDFTDVANDDVHLESINCLAYYGISKGTSADTFDPLGHVTRSQMALFLARAAEVADIDIPEAGNQGFTDVNPDDTERAAAINSLTAAEIMFGDTATSFDPPSRTVFGVSDHVTRWEMARFMFAFLNHALDSVIIDQLPDAVEGNSDGVGGIEHSDDDGDGVGTPVDDYYRDARRQTPAHIDAEIGAIWELGITDLTPGEEGRFNPNGLVTRGQMASFIMRALNHTNLRPEGVTAQYVDTETQVSVRGAGPDFAPVVDKRVEVFYTHFATVAFDSAGECVEQYVGAYDQSPKEACEIDRGDVETDDFGNALIDNKRSVENKLILTCTSGSYTLTIDKPSSEAAFRSWAWAGDLYDEVDSDTQRFEVVAGNRKQLASPAATHVTVEGGRNLEGGPKVPKEHFKMGESIEYTIRTAIRNPNASAVNEPEYLPALPVLGGQYGFRVVVRTHLQSGTATSSVTDAAPNADPPTPLTWGDWSFYTEDFPFDIGIDTTERTRDLGVYVPNSDGQIKIRVPVPDPVRGGPNRDNRDVQIQLQVIPVLGNPLTVVDQTDGMAIDATGKGWVTGPVTIGTAPLIQTGVNTKASRVSDNDPHPARVEIEPEQDLRVLAQTTQAYVSMTLYDQYGDRFTPWSADAGNTRTARRTAYMVGVNPASDRTAAGAPNTEPVARPVRARGKVTHNYAYGGPGGDGSMTPSVETIVVTADLINVLSDDIATTPTDIADSAAVVARVYWAGTGSQINVRGTTDAERVYLADTGQKLIAVEEATGQPWVYEYGSEDRFIVEGRVVSFGQFEQIIGNSKLLAGPDTFNYATSDNATLEWDDYRRHGLSRRPSTDADWRLNNLNCS